MSHYWDDTCVMGKVGCYADGKHVQCRYCGHGSYIGIPCPDDPIQHPQPNPWREMGTNRSSCAFPNPPLTKYYFDEECYMGKAGCLADGKHIGCRFCGSPGYDSIICPDDAVNGTCVWPHGQIHRHYWEPKCNIGKLGCFADGVHVQCRYCGEGNYSAVACPFAASAKIAKK